MTRNINHIVLLIALSLTNIISYAAQPSQPTMTREDTTNPAYYKALINLAANATQQPQHKFARDCVYCAFCGEGCRDGSLNSCCTCDSCELNCLQICYEARNPASGLERVTMGYACNSAITCNMCEQSSQALLFCCARSYMCCDNFNCKLRVPIGCGCMPSVILCNQFLICDGVSFCIKLSFWGSESGDELSKKSWTRITRLSPEQLMTLLAKSDCASKKIVRDLFYALSLKYKNNRDANGLLQCELQQNKTAHVAFLIALGADSDSEAIVPYDYPDVPMITIRQWATPKQRTLLSGLEKARNNIIMDKLTPVIPVTDVAKLVIGYLTPTN